MDKPNAASSATSVSLASSNSSTALELRKGYAPMLKPSRTAREIPRGAYVKMALRAEWGTRACTWDTSQLRQPSGTIGAFRFGIRASGTLFLWSMYLKITVAL